MTSALTKKMLISSQVRTVIVQPATLCNLDCGYCYLPGRHRQTLIPVKVASRLADSIDDPAAEWPVEVVLHGGEPLTTPVAHMRPLLAPFEGSTLIGTRSTPHRPSSSGAGCGSFVASTGCSLTETAFNASTLTAAVFDNCKLAGVSFDGCDLRGADLRGNDLTA